MRLSIPVVLLVAAVVTLPITPAAAANPRHERVYFECSDARVANFDQAPAGWSPAVPAATLSDGGGCGQADMAGHSSSTGPFTFTTGRFAGTFEGNLHSLNVRLDTVSVGTVQTGGTAIFDVTLHVDDRDALGGTRRLEVRPIAASQGHGRVHTYFFSVVGLPYMELDEDRVHTVEFTAEPVNQPMVAWTYGATEVPSGIEFNPTGYHPYKIEPQG